MNAQWVAGTVRARALLNRRVGRAGARQIATAPSVTEAVRVLSATGYGHDVRPEQNLVEAEHAAGAALLWQLRVLAGWQPRRGAQAVRLLAAGFEIANVDELVRRLTGDHGPEIGPYRLGALATAWTRLGSATSLAGLRAVLATSVWGDPGSDTAAAITLGLRLSWAERVAAALDDAAEWVAGGTALLMARELFVARRRLDGAAVRRARAVLGDKALNAATVAEYGRLLRGPARWALAEVAEPTDLWRAEARWWTHLERTGFDLVHGGGFGRRAVFGTVAVLAADAWRVRAALQLAARGGVPIEVFDAVA